VRREEPEGGGQDPTASASGSRLAPAEQATATPAADSSPTTPSQQIWEQASASGQTRHSRILSRLLTTLPKQSFIAHSGLEIVVLTEPWG
jgi:hypothetical protein